MKVRVNVTEVNYGSVVVEVDNLDEVSDAVYDAYCNGAVYWADTDIDYNNPEVEEDDEPNERG